MNRLRGDNQWRLLQYRVFFQQGCMANKTRTHVVIPETLIADFDALIGKRKRSWFITQVAKKEIERLKFLRTIEETSGAWSGEDHPELKNGSYNWLKEQRTRSNGRISP